VQACVRLRRVGLHGVSSYSVGDDCTTKTQRIFIQFQLLIFPFRSFIFPFSLSLFVNGIKLKLYPLTE